MKRKAPYTKSTLETGLWIEVMEAKQRPAGIFLPIWNAIKSLCHNALRKKKRNHSSFTLRNKNKGNQSSSCHFNFFVLWSQGFSKHFQRAEYYPYTETFMEAEHCLIFQVYSRVARVNGWSFRGQLLKVIFNRKRALRSLDCEWGRPTGCGAGKTREGKFSRRAAAVIT